MISKRTQDGGAASGGALVPSTEPKQPSASTDLERAFEADLKKSGLAPKTVKIYMARVRRFLQFVGDERLDRVSDDAVKAFFRENAASKREREVTAFLIGRFLRFAAARRPPGPRRETRAKELTVEQLKEAKERADDLIAKLGRRLIDCYVYLEARRRGDPGNLDEVNRLVDDCRELLQANLPLFLSLSAEGRNIHTLVDQRSQ